jgi:hypothetical protein
MSKSHILARKHLKQNSEYQKRHYDLKAVKRTLQVGQPVWLYVIMLGVWPVLAWTEDLYAIKT